MSVRIFLVGLLPLALPLFAMTAFADPPAPAAASSQAASPTGSAAGAPGATSAEDDDIGSQDDKPEHKQKRRAYIRRTKRQLDELLQPATRGLSDEAATVIRKHWHDTMRLWRIRNLADQAGDKASVAKADALIQKADERTFAKLKVIAARSATGVNAQAPGSSAGRTP